MLLHGTTGSNVCKCSHQGEVLLKKKNLMHKKAYMLLQRQLHEHLLEKPLTSPAKAHSKGNACPGKVL